MQLIIQIKNGNPYNHPILVENFVQAFPEINLNNLPSDYAWFERTQHPIMGPYTKKIYSKYELVGDIVKEVWYKEEMTEEEKQAKQAQVKQEWAQYGYSSWIFNEETCSFQSPIPYPTDGKIYEWNENLSSWYELI